ARDRLYLSGDLDGHGRLLRRQSSLAQLLPQTLADRFAEASAGDRDEVEWVREGESFALRVCRAPVDPPPVPPETTAHDAVPADIAPLQAGAPLVPPATAESRADAARFPEKPIDSDEMDDEWSSAERRLLGTIVHRVLARGLAADPSPAD